MKPLLLAVGVLVVQVLLFGGYMVVRPIWERKSAGVLLWPVGVVLLSLFLFMAVKAVCHECLTFPMAAVCERRGGDAVDVAMESKRVGGYIKERQFAGCVFYWHENTTGGD
jgi:hypothetical protein